MQRRDSLGSTTKIPRLSKGSTRKFKTRRSQSSFSSASDVFAENESTKGQPNLSVRGMRLRTNPVPPEADATPETRLPTVPQVSSVPDLTTVSQDTTMYASMFEPLNRSLETFITKLSKSTERGERSRRTLKKPK